MTPLFAMAGLAEAAFAEKLLVCWIGLGVVCFLALVAWLQRARLLEMLAALAHGFFAGFFEPWRVFLPWYDPQSGGPVDPDLIYWSGRYKVLGFGWILIVLMTVAFFLPTRRSFSKARQTSLTTTDPTI
jgi:hypothetical protein